MIAVLLGGAGASASADFQKNAIALTDLIQRNGLFYICYPLHLMLVKFGDRRPDI